MVVRSPADTDRIRYLLGLCSQAERERIEAEYFEDKAAFQAMLTAEDDLIDAYARDELTEEEQQRFETHFLTSTRGRDRVQFARALAGTVSGDSAVETRPAATWLNIFESLRGWPLQIATVAAVIVLVVSLSWIFIERKSDDVRNPRAEHAEITKQSETLPRSADAEPTRNAEATTKTSNLLGHSNKPRRRTTAVHAQRGKHLPVQRVDNRQNVATLVPGIAGCILGDERLVNGFLMFSVKPGESMINRDDATLSDNFERVTITELPVYGRKWASLLTLEGVDSSRGSVSASFSLESGSTKSTNLTTITLASSIKSITLQLRLDVAKPHREYRAVIETADGRPVTTLSWSTSDLSNIVDTPSLSTADLPSGDYVLFLSGKISNGSFIRVAEFSFRVVRK